MSIGNIVKPDVADDEYPTSDTSLAAYLFTEGYPINHIDHNQQRVVFIFANKRNFCVESIDVRAVSIEYLLRAAWLCGVSVEALYPEVFIQWGIYG